MWLWSGKFWDSSYWPVCEFLQNSGISCGDFSGNLKPQWTLGRTQKTALLIVILLLGAASSPGCVSSKELQERPRKGSFWANIHYVEKHLDWCLVSVNTFLKVENTDNLVSVSEDDEEPEVKLLEQRAHKDRTFYGQLHRHTWDYSIHQLSSLQKFCRNDTKVERWAYKKILSLMSAVTNKIFF